jgi:hypothetical protein
MGRQQERADRGSRRLGFFAALDETHGVVDEAEQHVVGGAVSVLWPG